MKIAYISLKGIPLGGGIEKYTEEVGSRLASKGHEIVVYTMRHYGAENGQHKGMCIKTVPTIKSRSLEKLVASFIASLYLIMEKDVDIVHMHAFGPAMFGFIPRLMRKKVITQGHGIEWKRSKWGLPGKLFLKLTEWPSVMFPHALTVVSKVQVNYINERYGRNCAYIPTGVNPPCVVTPELIREYGLKGNDYILFAARLVREKGAHYLIEAFNNIKTEKKLVIAGDAEYEGSYKEELARLANGNMNIIFTGFVTGKRLHELFSNCYLFVLPSEVEGLPIALLEAMSYGNCTLVSDIPENIEALNSFGYTFRSMDVNDLSDKLIHLISTPGDVARFKDRARNHVLENYSWDSIANSFENLYKSLLK